MASTERELSGLRELLAAAPADRPRVISEYPALLSQRAIDGILSNFPVKALATVLRWTVE